MNVTTLLEELAYIEGDKLTIKLEFEVLNGTFTTSPKFIISSKTGAVGNGTLRSLMDISDKHGGNLCVGTYGIIEIT